MQHSLEHQQKTSKSPQNWTRPPTFLFCICDIVVFFCQSAHPEMCFNNISAYYM